MSSPVIKLDDETAHRRVELDMGVGSRTWLRHDVASSTIARPGWYAKVVRKMQIGISDLIVEPRDEPGARDETDESM